MIDKSKLENLRELRKLLDEGEISESDYQNQKKQILELNRANKKSIRSVATPTKHKKRKKFVWISLIAILVCLIFLFGLFMAHSNASNSDKAKSNNTSSKSSQKTSQKESDSKNSDSVKNDKQGFNDLTQQQQLGVLIYKGLVDANIPIDAPDKKIVYMGESKKIVVYNEVGAGGGPLSHSFMIQDQGSTFAYSSIETNAESTSQMTENNCYWNMDNTYAKEALFKIYQQHGSDIEKIESLLDLSHSTEAFPYLPTDQTSAPEDDTNSESESDDSEDDEYYYDKTREANADYTLPDGTHMHNDDQGNSYNDDGEVIGKGGTVHPQ